MGTETIILVAVIILGVSTIINSCIGILLLCRTDLKRTKPERWNIETVTVADPDEFVRAVTDRESRREKLGGV